MKTYESWGRFPKVNQEVFKPEWRFSELPYEHQGKWLAFGNGRSYGDACLNDQGTLIDTSSLNHFISFDKNTGVLECESGVKLSEIIDFSLPRGFFPAVVPGTKQITLGGAIANDIHGKNHHGSGSFGNHVISIKILRSDNKIIECSETENQDYFKATIGGIGLTGLILSAKIRLKEVSNSFINVKNTKFESLEEFISLCKEDEKEYEYTVAWADFSGAKNVKGILYSGNHCEEHPFDRKDPKNQNSLSVPFDFPSFTLNRYSIGLFNELYYRKNFRKISHEVKHCDPFFFPLDSIDRWNRIYGKNGFFQFQFVLDIENSLDPINKMISEMDSFGYRPFLSVMKFFGDIPSKGILSFPRPGLTICLDFANLGSEFIGFILKLYDLVVSSGGRLYTAKDALMTPEHFRSQYTNLDDFIKLKDPNFSSSFWRRVYRP
jgi:FAD/FMN-containing dehydrogenase